MTTRIDLYDLVARRGLDKATADALWRIASFDSQPQRLLAWLKRGLGIVAAGLVGLGIIFWIAANWRSLSTFQQFVILQGLVLILCLGAAALPRVRVPLSLLGLISTGALFAFFGQTYQTGADPWQLFILWAGLTLPLALCARADSVWSAWVVVALAGIALWDQAKAGYSWWHVDESTSGIHLMSSCCALLLALLVSKPLRQYTGAGAWAFGFALSLSAVFITGLGVMGLDHSHNLYYLVSLLLFIAAAFAVASQRLFDVLAASVIGLALNTLLIAGLVELLFFSGHNEAAIGSLLVLGGAAAALLGLTVRTIMRLYQQHSTKGQMP